MWFTHSISSCFSLGLVTCNIYLSQLPFRFYVGSFEIAINLVEFFIFHLQFSLCVSQQIFCEIHLLMVHLKWGMHTMHITLVDIFLDILRFIFSSLMLWEETLVHRKIVATKMSTPHSLLNLHGILSCFQVICERMSCVGRS